MFLLLLFAAASDGAVGWDACYVDNNSDAKVAAAAVVMYVMLWGCRFEHRRSFSQTCCAKRDFWNAVILPENS